jgi:hypothetical protein
MSQDAGASASAVVPATTAEAAVGAILVEAIAWDRTVGHTCHKPFFGLASP